jgi:dTDP-4-dehydrorhamnose reductase
LPEVRTILGQTPTQGAAAAKSAVAIVGASGLIGQALFRRLKTTRRILGTCLSRPRPGLVPLDIDRREFSILDGFDWVIVAAGMTNIDRCKLQRQQAWRINVEAVVELAEHLARRKMRIVYLSSDQVFDGNRGRYCEDDSPNPINEYGRMKLQAEQQIRQIQPEAVVLRLSKTYSTDCSEGGILAEVIHSLQQGKPYAAAEDQIFNPTEADWLSEQIEAAIERNLAGLYHLADPRIESRYAFACRVAREYGFDPEQIRRVRLSDLHFPEARALNSSLDVSRILNALSEPTVEHSASRG